MKLKKDCTIAILLVLSMSVLKTTYGNDLFKYSKKQFQNASSGKSQASIKKLLDEKNQENNSNVVNKTKVNKIRAIVAKTKMPEGSKIYIAGDFNRWNYNDPAMELKQVGEMYANNQECFIYEGNFSLASGLIYEYSRGTVESTEVDFTLQDEKNQVTADENGNYLINDYINDWKDSFYTPDGKIKVPDYINQGKIDTASSLEKNNKVEVTFIASLSDSVDDKDNIYLCGDFNNWNYKDKSCKLVKQADGTYQIKKILPLNTRYKFSRGSEDNCEVGYFRILDKDYQSINVKIENWIDK
jgi:hypothetical protein